jgi:xanthine dehydrogenase molybdopterin-binding subunit B
VGGLPCGWQVTDKHGKPMQEPKHPVLADGKVRHVGDPICAVVAETCNRFNASQDQYEAVCVGQDGYEKAVQNTIAAFRAGKHPTIVQSFDAGTADLMLSGEFYPVKKLMEDD